MIVILMEYHGHNLQGAIDYVGDLCAQTINTFIQNRELVPKWGGKVDRDVELYVNGLQEWITG